MQLMLKRPRTLGFSSLMEPHLFKKKKKKSYTTLYYYSIIIIPLLSVVVVVGITLNERKKDW